jgi:hypothetical protein
MTMCDNGYKAFYRGKSIEVWALSSYAAQQQAAAQFRARKPYEVTVVLCQRVDGSTVTHQSQEFGS